jgi:hypothetical protein
VVVLGIMSSLWIGMGRNVLAPPFQEIPVPPYQGLQMAPFVQEIPLDQDPLAVRRTVFAKKQEADGIKIGRLGLIM